MRTIASSVVLDGAYGEGGGALVRTALIMSAITQQPFQISSVRGATRYPGLDVEDVCLVAALKEITGAETSEERVGADSLSFAPKHAAKGFEGSVGEVSNERGRNPNALILLNSLQSVLVHTGVYSTLVSSGETFGNNTLSYDSYTECTLEAMKRMGCYAYATLKEGAYGRESKGSVLLDVEPSYIQGIDWADRGDIEEVTAYISYSNLSEAIPQRAAGHLITLSRQSKLPINIELQKVSAATPGVHVTVCASYERGYGSGSAMGTRGVRVETVATSAFDQVFDYIQSKASIDPYLADQLLLLSVFANGPVAFSVSSISRRLLTAIWVIKQFMPLHVTVSGPENGPGLVSIRQS